MRLTKALYSSSRRVEQSGQRALFKKVQNKCQLWQTELDDKVEWVRNRQYCFLVK